MKHKNNQSLDTKIEKHLPGHLRYTTLLSKDQKMIIDKKGNIVPAHQHKKSKDSSKYFSAPVSTKENGLVTKFKFHDQKNDTLKFKAKDLESRKQSASSKTTSKKEHIQKVTPIPSESQGINIEHEYEENSQPDKTEMNKYDSEMPKNNDIQKLFSDTVNSPSNKIVHISQINSMDNFEDARNSSERETSENKAAVPILDFTQLPPKPKREEKKAGHDAYDDFDIGSNSIGSIFEQDSHLDLSSKRMKKLILTSDFSSLINLREEALTNKAKKEKEKLDILILNNKISPRTGQTKALKLEKWITKERKEIHNTKKIIEEACKKTEDVVKDAQVNGEYLKQIMSDKVMTPRDGHSVRSSMNSARRKFEQSQKNELSEQESDNLSSKSQNFNDTTNLEKQLQQVTDPQNLDNLIEKFGNKEIEIEINDNYKDKHENDKSDLDALCSVETPKIDSSKNSDLNASNRIILGPPKAEGDTSDDSLEPIFDKNRPVKLDLSTKDNLVIEDTTPIIDSQSNTQSLSRKKSEQRFNDPNPTLPNDPQKMKCTTTPTPQVKPGTINAFNSDKFFTQDFDDQEMDEAIEKLKSSSGKMDPKKEVAKQLKDESTPSDSSGKVDWNDTLNKSSEQKLKDVIGAAKDDYNLAKQVEKNKIVKTKESRNSDIKQAKNEAIEQDNLDEERKEKYYGVNDDIDFHRKNKVSKSSTNDSRNDKQVQNSQQKSSKTDNSLKEDIMLENVSDKIESDIDEKYDMAQIIGSQSLQNPESEMAGNGQHAFENSSEKDTDNLTGSDSKYATVSILSELNKKNIVVNNDELNLLELDDEEKKEIETTTANKLTDLIYSAMLAEIKAEVFPQRPLFLLTADLDKIELDQAMVYLNDMSVEKEAELLKEYLKYSGGDDVDFGSWDNEKNERETEENKMFSDSGKLVLYERKGISTDLFSIENYVDELSTEIDDK